MLLCYSVSLVPVPRPQLAGRPSGSFPGKPPRIKILQDTACQLSHIACDTHAFARNLTLPPPSHMRPDNQPNSEDRSLGESHFCLLEPMWKRVTSPPASHNLKCR